jgi:regulator of sigma E protease
MDAFLPQPGLLFTAAMFVVVIGILITIHEFGHYLAGRAFGVRAETFSMGFGRELLGWTDRRGTRWRLSALPFGGYVKFAGDMNAAGQAADLEQYPPEMRASLFHAKPLWQRALIVAAGPATNFLFAILVFFVFFLSVGRAYTPPVIAEVAPNSAAAMAGLQPGDRIVRLGSATVTRFEDIERAMALSTGEPMPAVVERAGVRLTLEVDPQMVERRDEYGQPYRIAQLGVVRGGREYARMGPVAAAAAAVDETWTITKLIPKVIGQILTGERSARELGGPLKIGQMSGQRAALGLPELVAFMALVSINLGFMNLLPIPVLDGGHLALYALEAVRRRPLGARAQELAFVSGFAALVSFMLFVTWNDLASFGVWERLTRLVG